VKTTTTPGAVMI